jgi:hypothetical protein
VEKRLLCRRTALNIAECDYGAYSAEINSAHAPPEGKMYCAMFLCGIAYKFSLLLQEANKIGRI